MLTHVRTRSFGYHRAEIIGALLSTIVIWAVTGERVRGYRWGIVHPPRLLSHPHLSSRFHTSGALLWEAIMRIQEPQEVDGKSERV